MPYEVINLAAYTDDGYVSGLGTSYPPAYTQESVTGIVNIAGKSVDGGDYEVDLTLLRFNTAVLPDDGIAITGAVLRFRVSATLSTDGRSLAADWYDWSPTMGASDYTDSAGTDAHAGTLITNLISDAENYLELTGLGNISQESYTYLRLHITGGIPSGSNIVQIGAFDSSNPIKPQLTVYYTEDNPTSLYVNQPPIVK